MKITRPLDNFIAAMLGDLTPTGKAWARVGCIVLVVAAAMSFDFGYAVSWKHAAFLACLTFVAAFGPEAAYKAINEGKWVAGVAIAVICAPLLLIEFYSHGGYTAGLRGNNLSEARVQNTKYDAAQSATVEEKTNLEVWKKQLSTLMEKDAWAATVKADGLRAQLAVAQKEIDLEASRGGCGPKCAQRMKDKADLEQRIATVEQATDLSKRIEATQRVLDGKREVAATVEHKSSAVAHQNAALAKWVAMIGFGTLQPTAMVEESAEQSANFMMALAGTGLPAFALFVAGLYRTGRRHDTYAPSEPVITPQARSVPLVSLPIAKTGPTSHDSTTYNVIASSTDEARDIIAKAKEAMLLMQNRNTQAVA